MQTQFRNSITFMFVGAIVLYFIFAPAIYIPFYNGDAFRYVLGGFSQSCKADDGFEFMLTLGRPLQAYLDCFVYKFAFTLERMKIIRLLSVTLAGCSLGLFALWLYRLGISVWAAFLASSCLFLVPHLYVEVVLVGALSLPIAILFTQFAYFLLNKEPKKKNLQFFAGIFLFIALLTYPAMAFFYGALMLTKVLFTDNKQWLKVRKEIFSETKLFILICAIYFVFAFLNMKFFPLAPVPTAYQINHPNFSPIEMLNRLSYLCDFFGRQWNLIILHPGIIQGWIMVVCLVGGVFLGLIRFLINNRQEFVSNTLPVRIISQKILFFVLLGILSSGFFLVIPRSEAGVMLRFLFGSIAFGFVTFLWVITQWTVLVPKKFKSAVLVGLLGIIFFIESYQSGVYTFANAFASNQYMDMVVKKVKKNLLINNNPVRIHYVLAESDYPYTKFFMTKEILNVLGLKKYQPIWCSLPRGIEGREEEHQTELMNCLNNLSPQTIGVTYSYQNEHVYRSGGMILVETQNHTVEDLRNKFLQKFF